MFSWTIHESQLRSTPRPLLVHESMRYHDDSCMIVLFCYLLPSAPRRKKRWWGRSKLRLMCILFSDSPGSGLRGLCVAVRANFYYQGKSISSDSTTACVSAVLVFTGIDPVASVLTFRQRYTETPCLPVLAEPHPRWH